MFSLLIASSTACCCCFYPCTDTHHAHGELVVSTRTGTSTDDESPKAFLSYILMTVSRLDDDAYTRREARVTESDCQ